MNYQRDTLPHQLRCPHTGSQMRPVMCQDCGATDLYTVYQELKRAYYAGDPYLSDKAFDRFEDMCRAEWPDDNRFHKVGG